MQEELKLIAQASPYVLPFLAAIMIIVFTKKYLFVDVVPRETMNTQIEREREIVSATKDVSNQLQEIVRQLERLTSSVNNQINENTERLRSLEHAMSDYLQAFHELNRNFELHRRGYTDTEQLRVTK
jgi:peptidoglycan hydrolase CwlO-like protein